MPSREMCALVPGEDGQPIQRETLRWKKKNSNMMDHDKGDSRERTALKESAELYEKERYMMQPGKPGRLAKDLKKKLARKMPRDKILKRRIKSLKTQLKEAEEELDGLEVIEEELAPATAAGGDDSGMQSDASSDGSAPPGF